MCCLPIRTFLRLLRGERKSGVLFDTIWCVTLVLGVYLHAAFIEPGMLYFGMKDFTAEFLKITLVYVALDVADKVPHISVSLQAGDLFLFRSCQMWALMSSGC